MNRNEIKNEIENIVKAARERKPLRKQYSVAKHQLRKLEELGITELMPASFGYMDAAAVISAATEKPSAAFNAAGEGDSIGGSKLYKLLNAPAEADEPEEVARYTFATDDGDVTYIVTRERGVYTVDADWSDGEAAEFDHEPSEDEVRAIHDDYVDTMRDFEELDALAESVM